MSDLLSCPICTAPHRFRDCPRKSAEARAVFGGPPPVPDATRHWGSVKFANHLRELEAEAQAPTPSPTSLRLLAGAVARDCPQGYSALKARVVRLADGLAGLLACQRDLAHAFAARAVVRHLREALQSACVALRVQVEAVPEALIEDVAHV